MPTQTRLRARRARETVPDPMAWLAQWLRETPRYKQLPASTRDEWLEQQSRTLGPLLLQLGQQVAPVDPRLVEVVIRTAAFAANPIKAALLRRGLHALQEVIGRLDDVAASGVLGVPVDDDVLIALLEQPAVQIAQNADDPLAAARLRGARARRTLLDGEGGTLAADEVATLLGMSRQAVDKRRRSGRLLALPIGQHRYAYPRWQFTPDGQAVLPGFEDALSALPPGGPWGQALFFLNPNDHLVGARPLDELRRGHPEPVLRAASIEGEQGPT